MNTYTQIKKGSINLFSVFSYPWSHALIEKCVLNCNLTAAVQCFCSNVGVYYSYSNSFLFLMTSENCLNSPVSSVWNIIHKQGFGAQWDLTVLITHGKSTEREPASVFMLLSLLIWSHNARVVLQRRNIIVHYDNPNNPTQRHMQQKLQPNAMLLSNNNPLLMQNINKLNLIAFYLLQYLWHYFVVK